MQNSGLGGKPSQMTASSTTKAQRTGWTILVIDDELAILEYVRRVLENGNYRVVTSLSADEAWAIIEHGQAQLDIVLTDIVMPGSIDGVGLADMIRQRNGKLPVLFMTGALPESDGQAAEMTKKRLLLRKPFSPRQLIEFVDSHLTERTSEH
jgi:CheY-like chemotaxis protein